MFTSSAQREGEGLCIITASELGTDIINVVAGKVLAPHKVIRVIQIIWIFYWWWCFTCTYDNKYKENDKQPRKPHLEGIDQ
jgi:hypothetical protein